MALRRPLYLDQDNNLRVMDEIYLDRVRTETVRQFAFDPSVLLIFDSDGDSNTSIGTMLDTRLQAGAYLGSDPFNFDTEGETPEPTFVTVTWDKIASTLNATFDQTFASRGYPMYWDSDAQQPGTMDSTDVKDTFVYPVIDRFVSGSLAESDAGGTYFISTIDSDSAGTLVNTLPIYTDTRADSSLYTAGGIPETLDQPRDVQNYYLFQTNRPPPQVYPRPVYVNDSNNIQCYQDSDFMNRLQALVREVAEKDAFGYQLRYFIDSATSPGGNKGSAIVNTRLSGDDGLYRTRFVNSNDYRAQEFPYGVPQTDNTYYLKARKQ